MFEQRGGVCLNRGGGLFEQRGGGICLNRGGLFGGNSRCCFLPFGLGKAPHLAFAPFPGLCAILWPLRHVVVVVVTVFDFFFWKQLLLFLPCWLGETAVGVVVIVGVVVLRPLRHIWPLRHFLAFAPFSGLCAGLCANSPASAPHLAFAPFPGLCAML